MISEFTFVISIIMSLISIFCQDQSIRDKSRPLNFCSVPTQSLRSPMIRTADGSSTGNTCGEDATWTDETCRESSCSPSTRGRHSSNHSSPVTRRISHGTELPSGAELEYYNFKFFQYTYKCISHGSSEILYSLYHRRMVSSQVWQEEGRKFDSL